MGGQGLAADLCQRGQAEAQRRAVGHRHAQRLALHPLRLQLPVATGVQRLLHAAAQAAARSRQAPQCGRALHVAMAAEPARRGAIGRSRPRQADAGHGRQALFQLIGHRQQGQAAGHPPGLGRAGGGRQRKTPAQLHALASGVGHPARGRIVGHSLQAGGAWVVGALIHRRPAGRQAQGAALASPGVEAQRHPQRRWLGVGQRLHLPGQRAIGGQGGSGHVCRAGTDAGQAHRQAGQQAEQGPAPWRAEWPAEWPADW